MTPVHQAASSLYVYVSWTLRLLPNQFCVALPTRVIWKIGTVTIDEALVRRLLKRQAPEWAGLPIAQVHSPGTVNAMYRLGDEMVVRLLRFDWGIDGLERELEWLPWLAPRLPVAVPVILFRGDPAEGYPWPWGVYR